MNIGIIGAMAEEVKMLSLALEDADSFEIGGIDFFTGKIKGHEVILSESGIGKVNAAITTALLIDRFKPDVVLNIGSAGGVRSEMEVGDLLISTETGFHDVDVTVFNYKLGQMAGEKENFPSSPYLVDMAYNAADRLSIKAYGGMILSGDQFVCGDENKALILDKFPEVCAVEMEAGAIAQCCDKFDIPFIVLRAISDVAGKDSNVSFEEFLPVAAKNSSELLLSMLDYLPQ